MADEVIKSDPIYVFCGTRQVKARIDAGVPLSEVVSQLVHSKRLVSDPQAVNARSFVLRRKDDGQVITDDNFEAALKVTKYFELGPAPVAEAAGMIDKLGDSNTAVVKKTVFTLNSLLKERGQFADDFLQRGGFEALQECVMTCSGNTLAYALLSMQHVMELDERGWQGIQDSFIPRLVHIVANEPLFNVARPATVILRRLVTLSPNDDPNAGFTKVQPEIAKEQNFVYQLVSRLSSADVATASATLALINGVLKGHNEQNDVAWGQQLEKLGAVKLVANDLESGKADQAYALAFQIHYAHYLFLLLRTELSNEHAVLLSDVLASSALAPTDDQHWNKLGYPSSSPRSLYVESGYLGLSAWHAFATSKTYNKHIVEQVTKPESRRCPLAIASNIIVLLLARQFDLESPSPVASQAVPVLRFYELHDLLLDFFIRMWNESSALPDDFERVSNLTLNAFLYASDHAANWAETMREISSSTYSQVRARELEEIEQKDQYERHPAVRQLRNRLFTDALDFMKQQRLQCLLDGAWFAVAPRATKKQSAATTWRFYRLAATKKTLHWLETKERMPTSPPIEELREKLEIPMIASVRSKGADSRIDRPFSPASTRRGSMSQASISTVTPGSATNQPVVFTISTVDDTSGVDLVAPDVHTLSEWVDGLNFLKQEQEDTSVPLRRTMTTQSFVQSNPLPGAKTPSTAKQSGAAAAGTNGTPHSVAHSSETSHYAQALADMAVKVKLLDLTGERIDLSPMSANANRQSTWQQQQQPRQDPGLLPPINTAPFWYADDI